MGRFKLTNAIFIGFLLMYFFFSEAVDFVLHLGTKFVDSRFVSLLESDDSLFKHRLKILVLLVIKLRVAKNLWLELLNLLGWICFDFMDSSLVRVDQVVLLFGESIVFDSQFSAKLLLGSLECILLVVELFLQNLDSGVMRGFPFSDTFIKSDL